jgi:hypothetical protein
MSAKKKVNNTTILASFHFFAQNFSRTRFTRGKQGGEKVSRAVCHDLKPPCLPRVKEQQLMCNKFSLEGKNLCTKPKL